MHRLEHLSTIIADLGDIFVFITPVTAVPIIVAVLFSEWNMLLPMLSVPATFFILGTLFRKLTPSQQGSEVVLPQCVPWHFSGSRVRWSAVFPFMLGLHMGFTDAFFEGMAGWTGTAFSMIRSVDTAPHALLFWRSYMQWIGGIGIIAFMIALGEQHRTFKFEDLPHRGKG